MKGDQLVDAAYYVERVEELYLILIEQVKLDMDELKLDIDDKIKTFEESSGVRQFSMKKIDKYIKDTEDARVLHEKEK